MEYKMTIRDASCAQDIYLLYMVRRLDFVVDATGGSPLHFAQNEEVARAILLCMHQDVNYPDFSGRTPLHTSSDWGLTRYLIGRGADANAEDYNGMTPLHLAENAEIAEELLNAGAFPNHADHVGFTPMFMARDGAIVEKLYWWGGLVNTKRDLWGDTPLNFAVSVDVAVTLINFGASVDSEDALGESIVRHAQGKIFKILVDCGADVDTKDALGNTMLHGFIRTDRDKALYLINNGADVNSRNAWLETPLMVAAEKEDYGITKALLESGASATPMNRYDNTVLDMVFPGGRIDHLLKTYIVSGK